MNTALLAPDTTEASLYLKLSSKERQKVATWRGLMERVFSAPDPHRQMEREAAALTSQRGFTLKTMQRYYYAIKAGGDWTVFIPKAALKRVGELPSAGQPREFVDYWHSLCLSNQRKIRPAFRLLVRQWEAGESIPGFGTWRDYWRKSRGTAPPCLDGWKPPVPQGWTYGNLWKLKPSAASLAVARQGRSALASHRPLVLKTRAGLAPGKIYMFDDIWWDNRCRFGAKDVRPLELGCMDVASAYQFATGFRPLIEDDWTGRKQSIRDREMRFLTTSVLTQTGFHPEGVTLVVEHGTAAISDDVEKLLFDMSGGLIRVKRGGMEGCAFADQYCGDRKGNSRSKALKECLGSLLHNEAGFLPAQMGKDRNHKPEQLKALQSYNNQLMQAAERLPQKYREILLYPMPSWSEFVKSALEIYDVLHERTEHDLEGWRENGWIESKWRLMEDMGWKSREEYFQIPMDRRAAVDVVLALPGMTKEFRLSPRAVWQRSIGNFTRLPVWTSALIMGEKQALEKVVRKNHTLVIEDSTVSDDPIIFPALMTSVDGSERLLPALEKFNVHYNPFDPSYLTISDAQYRPLGVCKRDMRVSYEDTQALVEKTKQAAKIEAEIMKPHLVARRKEIREKKKMHEQNAAAFAAFDAENKALPQGADADIAANVLEQFGAVRADDENWN